MEKAFVFTQTMMIDALEANGWRNVWDIYWTDPTAPGPGWGGLTLTEAFDCLLKDKNLLPGKGRAHE